MEHRNSTCLIKINKRCLLTEFDTANIVDVSADLSTPFELLDKQ
jgi:hypothetical protein